MIELVNLNEGESSEKPGNVSSWSDWIGMVASIGCAIHCAAMPFVIASLPALGLSFLADESFHQWMAVVCFVIALAAFVPGWRKHRRLLPAAVGVVGLTFICTAAFGLAGECCPSCQFVPEGSEQVVACEDACCEHCAAEEAIAAEALAATEAPAAGESLASTAETSSSVTQASIAPLPSSGFLSAIAPWLTPVGGIVLVVAHLLNRRFGCLCGCCEAPEPAGSEEE